MFCKKCGASLKEEDAFCGKCGAAQIETTATEKPSGPPPLAANLPPQPPEIRSAPLPPPLQKQAVRPKRKLGCFWAMIIFLAVTVLLFIFIKGIIKIMLLLFVVGLVLLWLLFSGGGLFGGGNGDSYADSSDDGDWDSGGDDGSDD